MPQAGKDTLFVKFILSQASKDMQKPLIPMAFPALSAHLTYVKFKDIFSNDRFGLKYGTNLIGLMRVVA